MMNELKPCECGYKAVLLRFTTGAFFVKCTKCKQISVCYRTKEEAIKAWNRRVDDVT